jgi:hypothetical protein
MSDYVHLKALVGAPQSRRSTASGRPPDAASIGTLSPAAAAEAVCKHEIQDVAPRQDRVLLDACKVGDRGAFLCLRCRVSHPLEKGIRALHEKYEKYYGLNLIDLASYVLDDDGRDLSYTQLLDQPTSSIRPFTAQVVCSFDSDQSAGLPHWARIKLKANNELKAHLRQHGLLLISPWALLADSSSRRIRQAWEVFGAGSLTADCAVALHEAYCKAYPEARAAYRNRSKSTIGWLPSHEFLKAIAPDQPAATTLEQLISLDYAVRHVLSERWQRNRAQLEDSEVGPEVADPSSLEEVVIDDYESSSKVQLSLIHSALAGTLDAFMPSVLQPVARDPILRCLWQGFGEGLTNAPLAKRCGCARGTVSKKLRPEQHATTVAREAAAVLCRHPSFAGVASSPEGCERMVEALRNHLLTPEREGEIAPLRLWVHNHLVNP